MNCHHAIAHALKAEGVEYLFAFPHNPVIDACARVGIKPIIGRTERTIINMADGYSRGGAPAAHRGGGGPIRTRCRKRVRRSRPGVRRFDPFPGADRLLPGKPLGCHPDVRRGPQLPCNHQVGRPHRHPGRDPRPGAAGLHAPAQRQVRTGPLAAADGRRCPGVPRRPRRLPANPPAPQHGRSGRRGRPGPTRARGRAAGHSRRRGGFSTAIPRPDWSNWPNVYAYRCASP